MSMEIVRLSPEWLDIAFKAAAQRTEDMRRSYGKNFERHYGDDPQNVPAHNVTGTVSEIAAAKFTDLPWSVGYAGSIDVGGLLEARGRKVPGSGTDLGIRPKDLHLERPFVLVHVLPDYTCRIVGWEFGYHARARGRWNAKREVWFVPPPYRPLDKLLELVAWGRKTGWM